MDIIKKRFGEQLKTLRKLRNFTQESLVEQIGINLRQLARIEAGVEICSKVYTTKGEIKSTTKTQDSNNVDTLKQNIQSIAKDKKKLEYMSLAFHSLTSKEALNELKILIRGIELMQG